MSKSNGNKNFKKPSPLKGKPRPSYGNPKFRNPRKSGANLDSDSGNNWSSVENSPSSRGRSNDPSWYGAGHPDSNNVAQLYFSNANGLPLSCVHTTNVNHNVDVQNFAVPGIATHYITHAFGSEVGYLSPLNQGSNAEFALQRRANAGSKNYDAPDNMTFILAMAEVFSLINHLIRAYGTVNKYYTENKYFGQALLKEMGFDWESAHGRRADFASYINDIIALASQYCLPANLPYFTRRAYLYSQIYMENDTVKSQVYLFRPNGFYKYMDPDDSYPEAYLKFEACPDYQTEWTIDEWHAYAIDLFTHLMMCQDAAIISGDISKAFGANIIQLKWLDDAYMISPVPHDYNVLYQIRNATLVAEYTPTSLHQSADKSILEYNPHVSASDETIFQFELESMQGNRLLTSDNLAPDAGEILESTRFMATWNDVTEVSGGLVAHPCIGTEVMTHIVYTRNYAWASNPWVINTWRELVNRSMEWDPEKLAMIACFKYHPTIFQVSLTEYRPSEDPDLSRSNVVFPLQDLDNVITVDQDTLAKIHHFAVRNLLAQPAIDALTRS